MMIGFFIATLLVRRDFFLTPEIMLRELLIGFCFVFGTAFLYHAAHYFPVERPDLIRRRWIAVGILHLDLLCGCAECRAWASPLAILLSVFYGIGIMIISGKVLPQSTGNTTTSFAGPRSSLFWRRSPWHGSRGTRFRPSASDSLRSFCSPSRSRICSPVARHRLLDLNFRVRRNTQYTCRHVPVGSSGDLRTRLGVLPLPSLELPQANIVFTGTAIEINDAPELSVERETSEHIMLMSLALIITFTVLRDPPVRSEVHR
jgi:hypothetical protein